MIEILVVINVENVSQAGRLSMFPWELKSTVRSVVFLYQQSIFFVLALAGYFETFQK